MFDRARGLVGLRQVVRRWFVTLAPALLLTAAIGCQPAPEHGQVEGSESADSITGASPTANSGLPARFELEFLGDFNFTTGATVEGSDFGGLSGIRFDPRSDTYIALSDGRPDTRYFTLTISVDDAGIEVVPTGVTYLQTHEDNPSIPTFVDSEAIAIAPNGNLFITSEGKGDTHPDPRIDPAILEYTADGHFLRAIPIPDKYMGEREGPQTRGTRDNLGFEAMVLSPDGSRLFAATESALAQDDPPADFEAGSRARLIEFAIEGDEVRVVGEYVYPIDPVAEPPDFGRAWAVNGVVELLALDNNVFLALERTYVEEFDTDGPRKRLNRARLYKISLADADDIKDEFTIKDRDFNTVEKELLFDFDEIVDRLSPGYPSLDNYEGMCFGPPFPDGGRTLVVVSDNNFLEWQRTSFLLFKIAEN